MINENPMIRLIFKIFFLYHKEETQNMDILSTIMSHPYTLLGIFNM